MRPHFPYRYRVLILLFFLILILSIDRVAISLVGVRIKTEFGLSNEQMGWVLGAFTLAYALFEIPAGVWADHIGQKRVLIRIVLWWSLFTALTGATTGFASLLVTRFLFGAGEAGAFPTATGAIARWTPAKERGRGTSWLFIGSSCGAALAPLLVITIAQAYGWRTSFLVNGAIGIAWVLVCLAWFKNEPADMKGISKKEVQLIETGRRLQPHQGPFPWKTVFRDKNVLSLFMSMFCAYWALHFFISWMPVYLQLGKHFKENAMKTTASSLFLCGIVGGLSGGFVSDWLVKRKGVKFARRCVGSVCLTCEAALFLTAAMTQNHQVISAALMCAYFFIPIMGANGFSTCVDIGGTRASTVAGCMSGIGYLGGFFLTIFFGKLADFTHSYDIPVFLIAGVLLIGSLLWLNTNAAKKIAPQQAPPVPTVQWQ